MTEPLQPSWDDCKVAYGIDNEEMIDRIGNA